MQSAAKLTVVVDVQLGIRVCLASRLEGDPDEILAEDVVEDGGAEGTVLLEHLVDDVPGVDLALPARHQLRDVVLHHGGEGRLVVDRRHPRRKLAVPDCGVATHQLAVGGRKVDGLVGGAEVEVSARRLGGIPFHAVQCGQ